MLGEPLDIRRRGGGGRRGERTKYGRLAAALPVTVSGRRAQDEQWGMLVLRRESEVRAMGLRWAMYLLRCMGVARGQRAMDVQRDGRAVESIGTAIVVDVDGTADRRGGAVGKMGVDGRWRAGCGRGGIECSRRRFCEAR